MAFPTIWTFRPSALLEEGYEHAGYQRLMQQYLKDGRTANKIARSETLLPPKPQCADAAMIRTCQWNIHYLEAPWIKRSGFDLVNDVGGSLLATDADLLVMNEFGVTGRSVNGAKDRVNHLCDLLEENGYSILESPCQFPTAIATRLPVLDSGRFSLCGDRAAAFYTVDASQDSTNSQCSLKVYGTHLDYENGKKRLAEMTELVRRNQDMKDRGLPTLILGDFNQQRQRDYTEEEWKTICANMAKRNSLRDDGVSRLLQENGFSCCWDDIASKNWNGDRPPSTHWSGTVIDYAYSRGSTVSLVGIYVMPYNHSDHRMIVCDWKIQPQDIS